MQIAANGHIITGWQNQRRLRMEKYLLKMQQISDEIRDWFAEDAVGKIFCVWPSNAGSISVSDWSLQPAKPCRTARHRRAGWKRGGCSIRYSGRSS
jgi:hypothetical protein